MRRRALLLRGLLPAVMLLAGAQACRPESADPAESERIVAALALAPGMRVADVGAGDGRWAAAIAARVGDEGHVWATEVDDEEIERIEDRIGAEALANVTAVRGDERDAGLPDGCCDAILLRLVYHHFTDPAAMRASLARALAPGGRLVVVDVAPQKSWRRLDGVPDRGGHGVPADALVAEMTGDGWEVVSRADDWPGGADRFCVVFRRAAAGVSP